MNRVVGGSRRGVAGLLVVLVVLFCVWMSSGAPAGAAEPASAWEGKPADYSLRFDASRDPQRDFSRALAAAAAGGKRVLVMVGGDWCVWCFLLDRHLRTDPEAARTLYGGFEVLRVYYGEDNTNDDFLAAFPQFEMFPHFFVVETDGRVLASVDADVLIAEAKFDTGLLHRFARAWHVR